MNTGKKRAGAERSGRGKINSKGMQYMRIADNWTEYRIIDTTSQEKLESWNGILLIRPDPQIIWKTSHKSPLWDRAQGHYHRSSSGGGKWSFTKKPQESWEISYGELKFNIKPTGFKHTGLFPEQAVNWDFMMNKIKNAGRPVSVINLFAYTGGATLACAKAGASVCHVDASKGMVNWAKKTLRFRDLLISRYAGWWTTAENLLKEKSGGAESMTRL